MNFTIVLAKEFREIVRTRKIIVLPAVFLFFGIFSPLLLHITPELLKSQGLNISMPPPTPEMAAGEYFESATLFGTVALILVSMGAVAEERSKGSLAIVLSKPLRRSYFLLAKLLSISALTMFSFILGAVSCLYYTQLLIGNLKLGVFFPGVFLLMFFLSILTAITILFSIALRSQMAAGGASIATLFILSFLPTLGGIFKTATPYSLVRLSGEYLTGGSTHGLLLALTTNAIVLGSVMLMGWILFSGQEI